MIATFLRKLFKCELPVKDPFDFNATPSSTLWIRRDCCPECRCNLWDFNVAEGLCSDCGARWDSGAHLKIDARKIWNGECWVSQWKFDNECYYIYNPRTRVRTKVLIPNPKP